MYSNQQIRGAQGWDINIRHAHGVASVAVNECGLHGAPWARLTIRHQPPAAAFGGGSAGWGVSFDLPLLPQGILTVDTLCHALADRKLLRKLALSERWCDLGATLVVLFPEPSNFGLGQL